MVKRVNVICDIYSCAQHRQCRNLTSLPPYCIYFVVQVKSLYLSYASYCWCLQHIIWNSLWSVFLWHLMHLKPWWISHSERIKIMDYFSNTISHVTGFQAWQPLSGAGVYLEPKDFSASWLVGENQMRFWIYGGRIKVPNFVYEAVYFLFIWSSSMNRLQCDYVHKY